MLTKITGELQRYEREAGLKVLFAVEAGSRAWGFESADSDYDVRIVYERPLSWYLSIQDRRDVFEPVNEFPLDINGWDLKKALNHIYKGNPCFIEWLNSPIVYQDSPVREELLKLAKKYFNPRTAIYHYLHMAQGNFREYLRTEEVWTKKYLYVIRPILACMHIEETHSMPPVRFESMAIVAPLEAKIPYQEICSILQRKREGEELGKGPRIEVLNTWLHEKIEHFAEKARLTQRVEVMPDDLNEYLFNKVGRTL